MRSTNQAALALLVFCTSLYPVVVSASDQPRYVVPPVGGWAGKLKAEERQAARQQQLNDQRSNQMSSQQYSDQYSNQYSNPRFNNTYRSQGGYGSGQLYGSQFAGEQYVPPAQPGYGYQPPIDDNDLPYTGKRSSGSYSPFSGGNDWPAESAGERPWGNGRSPWRSWP